MDRNSLLPTTPALHVSSVSRPLIWIKTCTQSLSSASSRLSAAAATDMLGSATPTNATVKMFAGARPSAAGHRLTPHPDTAQSDFFDNNVDTPVLSYNLKGSSSWTFGKPLPLLPSHSHSHTPYSSYSTSTTSTMARTPSWRSKPKRHGPDLGTLTTDKQQLTLHVNDSDDQESDFLDTPVVAPREHTQRSFAQDHHLLIIKNDTLLSPTQSQSALDSELLSQDMDMDGFIGFIPIMLVTDDVRK